MIKTVTPLLLMLLVLWAVPAQAQDLSTYVLQPESELWIDGTSNKSDWTVYALEMSGHVKMNGTAEAPGFAEARVVVAAQEMKSKKSTIMDRLMHKTLKAPAHPEIVYALDSAAVVSSVDGVYTLNATGQLTLAGQTRSITMPVEAHLLDDGKLQLKGQYTLLMSDYGLTRPTAMFGALRTGDEVVIHFDLVMAEGDL